MPGVVPVPLVLVEESDVVGAGNSLIGSGSWEKDPAAALIPPQPRFSSVVSSLKDPWEGGTWEGNLGSSETPGKMHELVPVQSQNTQTDTGPRLTTGATKDLFPHQPEMAWSPLQGLILLRWHPPPTSFHSH